LFQEAIFNPYFAKEAQRKTLYKPHHFQQNSIPYGVYNSVIPNVLNYQGVCMF